MCAGEKNTQHIFGPHFLYSFSFQNRPNAERSSCQNPRWGTCTLVSEYLHNEPIDDDSLWECRVCPDGANCEPGDGESATIMWSSLQHKSDYWKIPKEWTNAKKPFQKCPYLGSCNATDCTAGHTGPVCAICSPDYFRSATGTCVPCGEATARTVENVAMPCALVVFVVFLFVVKRNKIKELRRKYQDVWRDIMRILTINISYAQINSSLSIIVPIQWPQEYADFMENMKWANFDVMGLFSVRLFFLFSALVVSA